MPPFRPAAAFALLMAVASPVAAETPDITGQWQSVAPEAMGEVHATRAFTFGATDWSVVFNAYGDAAAQVPLFTLDVGGVYVIGGPSAAVPGANDAIFPATRRQITAQSAAGVAMFGAMGCTLQQGVALPLTDAGCGFVPGLMQAMGEYDLVRIDGGQLFLGDRAGDLTKARPAALTPFALQRP